MHFGSPHRQLYRLQKIVRNADVRVDKDQHIPGGVTRTRVARAGDALHRLENNRRPAGTCNVGGSIHAVVVYDDRLDVRVRPCGQHLRRGSDRVQGGGEIRLLIESRDNNGEPGTGIHRYVFNQIPRRQACILSRRAEDLTQALADDLQVLVRQGRHRHVERIRGIPQHDARTALLQFSQDL